MTTFLIFARRSDKFNIGPAAGRQCQCQIGGRHLLYAGRPGRRAVDWRSGRTTRAGEATTPNVVCDVAGTYRPARWHHGDAGDRSKGRRSDDRPTAGPGRAGETTGTVAGGRPGDRSARRDASLRQIALRRVKTRPQRLNYSTADQRPALQPPRSMLSKQLDQTNNSHGNAFAVFAGPLVV